MPTILRIAAAVIVDDAGRVLLVRKRGTDSWMQPGGKVEPGEHPADTLARELHEELGLTVNAAEFEHWGRFGAEAANEKDHIVDCEIFALDYDNVTSQLPLSVAAEIDELLWLDITTEHGLTIAPLSLQHVFPRVSKLFS
ncbi:MAG: NUDIX hydrolase [Microbacteriaceae bacterium]